MLHLPYQTIALLLPLTFNLDRWSTRLDSDACPDCRMSPTILRDLKRELPSSAYESITDDGRA